MQCPECCDTSGQNRNSRSMNPFYTAVKCRGRASVARNILPAIAMPTLQFAIAPARLGAFSRAASGQHVSDRPGPLALQRLRSDEVLPPDMSASSMSASSYSETGSRCARPKWYRAGGHGAVGQATSRSGRRSSAGTRASSLLGLLGIAKPSVLLRSYRTSMTGGFGGSPSAIQITPSARLSLWIKTERHFSTGHYSYSSRGGSSARSSPSFRQRFDRIPPNYIVYGIIGINVLIFLLWQYATASWVDMEALSDMSAY